MTNNRILNNFAYNNGGALYCYSYFNISLIINNIF
jgi:predicted outer membrane repeat protein